MKKVIFVSVFLIQVTSLLAQTTVTADRVIAREGLYIKNNWVDSVQRSGDFDNHRTIPTSKAVADYLIAKYGAQQLSDSSFKIGEDTIVIRGTSGSGGITQLTGHVVAGPGTGSVVATIPSNTITNSMINSVDYSKITNTPSTNPGVYFSPAQSFDPSFVVFASAIVTPNSSFVHGQPITYLILDHATAHNSSFYDSAYGNTGNERLHVRYPPTKNVINSKLCLDETLAAQGLFVGPTVGVENFEAPVYQMRSVGMRINGDGAGNWVTNGDPKYATASKFTFSAFNSGLGDTWFHVGGVSGYDPDQIGLQYVGDSAYGIKRLYSGLSTYTVRFRIINRLNGLPLTTNPTANDEILITNAGMQSLNIPMATYTSGINEFMTGFANFWVDGTFECWMVAAPVTTSSIQIRWQNYPSATQYKIYRASSLYGTKTLIHTGTDNSYIDSGLSSGTLYWYFMVATIGGVDTEITYFRTSTKN